MIKNPTVELRFRSIKTSAAQSAAHIPMVQVADIRTGEVLMVELLGDIATWLAAMGYQYQEGTTGLWEKEK